MPKCRSRLLLRSLAAAFIVLACVTLPSWHSGVAEAVSAPPTVDAFLINSTSLSGLEAQAKSDAEYFAQHQPGGSRVLILDFGKPLDISSGVWGTCDFSTPYCTSFSNSDILAALKAASDGIHDAYVQGETTIVYGTSNYEMTADGLSDNDAYNVGYWQEKRANDLLNYEINNGYGQQSATAGSDTETGYSGHVISNELVKGANAVSDVLYYDYGDAGGCQSDGSCNGDWHLVNVGYASYQGIAVPMPDIYYTSNATEWTLVRNNWLSSHAAYTFWGITAWHGLLNPQTAWNTLYSDNPGDVYLQPGIDYFGQ